MFLSISYQRLLVYFSENFNEIQKPFRSKTISRIMFYNLLRKYKNRVNFSFSST